MAYLDKLFKSYRKNILEYSPKVQLAQEEWLDGPAQWRKHLREVGLHAKGISEVSDIGVARRQWRQCTTVYLPWAQNYIAAVPLLRETNLEATYNDKVFRRFMKDLAALADL